MFSTTTTITPFQAVIDALEVLKGNPKRKTGNAVEIKGFANASRGLVTYIVNCYPLMTPKWTLVELRRGRGDALDFHHFFHSVIEQLGPLVISKGHKAPEADLN